LSPDAQLTTSRIFRFYYPLALSWLFMSIESPISIGLISRLPNAEVDTAAFLVLMGLALWIESPVIDLLATSTTLCRNRQSFAVLSRFALWLMGWCTFAHALVSLTPLYGFVTARVLSVPVEVAEALHRPLAIMIPWSACIGWRRYRQGILIRSGRTRLVGMGTAIRMSTMAVSGLLLYASGRLPGVEVAATALICSVFAEALFVHAASKGPATELPESGSDKPLATRQLLKFHLPLTATTMLTLATLPIVAAAVAKAHDPVLQLAAWQVTTTLVWMHRTIVFALPEAVIALYRGPESVARLRRFCVAVGITSSASLLLLWLTRTDLLFFRYALGASERAASIAHFAVGLCVAIPVVGALQSYARGMLTVHHNTLPRLAAVSFGMLALFASLGLGLSMGWPGVAVAAFAMSTALVAEWAVLAAANVRSLRKAHA